MVRIVSSEREWEKRRIERKREEEEKGKREEEEEEEEEEEGKKGHIIKLESFNPFLPRFDGKEWTIK